MIAPASQSTVVEASLEKRAVLRRAFGALPRGALALTIVGSGLMIASAILLDFAGFWFYYRGSVCFESPCPDPRLVGLVWLSPVGMAGLVAVAALPLGGILYRQGVTVAAARAGALAAGSLPFAWWYLFGFPKNPDWPGWPALYQPGGPYAEAGPLIIIGLAVLGCILVWIGVRDPRPRPRHPHSRYQASIMYVWVVVIAVLFDSLYAPAASWPAVALPLVAAGLFVTGAMLALTRNKSSL